MAKNILIIDDSALMRRVLSDIIKTDDRFQVIDIASNGLEALSIMQSKGNEIDAILLDINMPKMNGLEFLAELKVRQWKANVIVVSTIATKEAKETIKALELGAFDFVTKPESYSDVKSNSFSNRILKSLEVATKTGNEIGMNLNNMPISDIPAKNKKEKKREVLQEAEQIIALACSTGGPKALQSVIPYLPEDLNAAMLVVQHMPEGFTKSLADRLNELSLVHVKEAEDGEMIQKGTVYIAKGGYQLRVQKHRKGDYRLSVSKEAARHGLIPCADIMFESLANTDYDMVHCIVLTGMGGDGTAGIKYLNKYKNTYVIAQDEESSIVYGMPKVVKEAGLVDEVVALNHVSEAIIKNVGVH